MFLLTSPNQQVLPHSMSIVFTWLWEKFSLRFSYIPTDKNHQRNNIHNCIQKWWNGKFEFLLTEEHHRCNKHNYYRLPNNATYKFKYIYSFLFLLIGYRLFILIFFEFPS